MGKDLTGRNRYTLLKPGITSSAVCSHRPLSPLWGPDVRWVGTETGQGRLTEWSVLPLNANQQASIAANSQKDMTFAPIGNLMNEDLGSRQQLLSAKGLIWYPAETDVSIRPGWFYHDKEDSKVRTPAGLMDLYFSSVGRNSVLLLNIPPNRQGLISDADVRSLQGWRKDMDSTFGINLAAGATVSSPNGIACCVPCWTGIKIQLLDYDGK
jgi:alpha-L-fucosidase